jgi:hypothetical protein
MTKNSYAKKSSIHFDPVKSNSETHNLRLEEKRDYLLEVGEKNYNWIGDYIQDRLAKIKEIHANPEFKNRKWQERSTPIRESVLNLDESVFFENGIFSVEAAEQKLKNLANALNLSYGISYFQLHIHLDEGKRIEGKETPIGERNLHAHMLWDWQDKKTGRMVRLSKNDLSKIQTITAECLGMKRGQLFSKAERLGHNELRVELKKLDDKKEHLKHQLSDLQSINNNLKEDIEQQEKFLSTIKKQVSDIEKELQEKYQESLMLEKENQTDEDIEKLDVRLPFGIGSDKTISSLKSSLKSKILQVNRLENDLLRAKQNENTVTHLRSHNLELQEKISKIPRLELEIKKFRHIEELFAKQDQRFEFQFNPNLEIEGFKLITISEEKAKKAEALKPKKFEAQSDFFKARRDWKESQEKLEKTEQKSKGFRPKF